MTLVEIVIALLLISLAVGTILTMMVGQVRASVRHRDATSAMVWLQNAAEHLQLVPLELCGSPTSVAEAYEDAVQADVESVAGWRADAISVTAIKFWNGIAFSSDCTDRAQLLTLSVTTPHNITMTLDVVMGNALGVDDGTTDDSSVCRFVKATFTDKKSGLLQQSPLVTLPLKKPSTKKASELKSRYLSVAVEMAGTCSGELRLRYKYPHRTHFHWRTVKLRVVKGQPTLYSGKFGNRRDKYLSNAVIDVRLEQGRSRRKNWGVVRDGDLRGLVVTQ